MVLILWAAVVGHLPVVISIQVRLTAKEALDTVLGDREHDCLCARAVLPEVPCGRSPSAMLASVHSGRHDVRAPSNPSFGDGDVTDCRDGWPYLSYESVNRNVHCDFSPPKLWSPLSLHTGSDASSTPPWTRTSHGQTNLADGRMGHSRVAREAGWAYWPERARW